MCPMRETIAKNILKSVMKEKWKKTENNFWLVFWAGHEFEFDDITQENENSSYDIYEVVFNNLQEMTNKSDIDLNGYDKQGYDLVIDVLSINNDDFSVDEKSRIASLLWHKMITNLVDM